MELPLSEFSKNLVKLSNSNLEKKNLFFKLHYFTDTKGLVQPYEDVPLKDSVDVVKQIQKFSSSDLWLLGGAFYNHDVFIVTFH